jgi:phosphatidylglycerophosphatase A
LSVAANLSPRLLLDPIHFFALGAGSGLAPRAPGTAGSLVGLAAAWPTLSWPLSARIALVVVVVLAGIWICGASARRLGVHDHPSIVFDEVAGMLATSLISISGSFLEMSLAFVFFRLFDILKPWPIRDVDHRLKGGAGIMLDDLMAAVYAAVCVRVIQISLLTA